MRNLPSTAHVALALALALAACGDSGADRTGDEVSPPPAPALDNAATSGPSVTVPPDTAPAH